MTIHPKGFINKPEPRTDYLPISAKEACEKTETFVKVRDKEQLKEIFNKIRAQIVAGKYSLDIHEPLSSCNRQILKEYGYDNADTIAYEKNFISADGITTYLSYEKEDDY